jgi:hypothetical protein
MTECPFQILRLFSTVDCGRLCLSAAIFAVALFFRASGSPIEVGALRQRVAADW